MSPSALQALEFHAWPGNVRELRNVIERAVIICSGEQIERHHFAPYPIEQRERLRNEDTLSLPVGTPLEEVERQMAEAIPFHLEGLREDRQERPWLYTPEKLTPELCAIFARIDAA